MTKIHVAIECYGLITEGIHLFKNSEAANEWFKNYTGYDYDEFYGPLHCLDEDYDQTKIFVIDLPEWLEIKDDICLRRFECNHGHRFCSTEENPVCPECESDMTHCIEWGEPE